MGFAFGLDLAAAFPLVFDLVEFEDVLPLDDCLARSTGVGGRLGLGLLFLKYSLLSPN